MLLQVIVVAVVVVLTVLVSVASRRRGSDAVPTPSGFTVPARVARPDFDHPDRPWLVVVFTSDTCDGCAGVVERALPLSSDEVAGRAVSGPAQPESQLPRSGSDD